MTLLVELAIAVVAATAGLGAEKFYRHIGRRFQLRKSRRFFDPWLNGDAVIVSATTQEKPAGRTRGTGPFDARALERFTSFLTDIASWENVPDTVTEQYPGNWRSKDVIALGGPVNNSISDQCLDPTEQLGLQYVFNSAENRIELVEGHIVESPAEPNRGELSEDYGLISRLPHPTSDENDVLVIAGCWGHGTLGGVHIAIDEIDELWDQTEGEYFQVVFSVEFGEKNQYSSGEIQWETLYTVDPSTPDENWSMEPRSPPDTFDDSVSMVVPCRNEEDTVADVVDTYHTHDSVAEVIVVDNDSEDATARRAEQAGATVIQESTVGKGTAVASGVETATEDHVFLIDGDIENAKSSWLTELLEEFDRHELDIARADPEYYPPLVTICVKPMLEVLFPDIPDMDQPLGGILLARRDALDWEGANEGWGIDVALSIQVAERHLSYDEIDIGPLIHGERDAEYVRAMAREIIATILSKANVQTDRGKTGTS
jgi:glucosyl-3-phosphoglycerate synthase